MTEQERTGKLESWPFCTCDFFRLFKKPSMSEKIARRRRT